MTTSGSTNFSVSRDDIIKAALRKIGAVATGETPNADEINDGSQALNLLIKEWMSEGVGLWLYDVFSITLVANSEYYTFGTGGDVTTVGKPLGIFEARYHYYTSDTDLPMTAITKSGYLRLPYKASGGTPTQFYYDPQLSLGYFYIWPVVTSSTSDTIIGTAKVMVEDFDAAANTPDFPQEWYSALMWNLALDLAPEYGKEPTPFIGARANNALLRAQGNDREHSTYFGLKRR